MIGDFSATTGACVTMIFDVSVVPDSVVFGDFLA